MASLKVPPPEIVAAAREWLGTPWRHQGRLKGIAVDCGGLFLGVGRELGVLDFDTRVYGRIPDGQQLRALCASGRRLHQHLSTPPGSSTYSRGPAGRVLLQVAIETEHHLIVANEVTNVGSDRSQLATMAKEAKAVLRAERLDAVADRGYFNSEEILACAQAGITVTLPKPMTSGAKAEGRFGKQDFVYKPEEDVYRCPAGKTLKYRYTNVENGLTLCRYWTTACPSCPIKSHCTPAKQRRITRWEHEPVLDAVQRRLDENPKAMRQRRETVEHPFGTIKARMGAMHFLMKTLPRVSGGMALHVLAYNLTRVMNMMGVQQFPAAIRT